MSHVDAFLAEMITALGGSGTFLSPDQFLQSETGELPSYYATTDLAVASMAAAGLALAAHAPDGSELPVQVNRKRCSYWFNSSVRPIGWTQPQKWGAVSGDYRTKDGWLRIHANAPHHRTRALEVLGDAAFVEAADRASVAAAVAQWRAQPLESAIIEAGGCAAAMRTEEEWSRHPAGAAVSAEPLIAWRISDQTAAPTPPRDAPDGAPLLRGVRVLDLTRVLAGPAATRFLAGYGADVLRIDPEGWNEPAAELEMTLGKRCAGLNLQAPADREIFEALLRDADLLIHGYRSDALTAAGYDVNRLRILNPRLVDVALDAFGWTGPWAARRGFDSVVQMACGIAAHGMEASAAQVPVALPVQALDHATGYLIAAAALCGLAAQKREGRAVSARLSLARTAELLKTTRRDRPEGLGAHAAQTDDDIAPEIEATAWGDVRRIRFPMTLGAITPSWRLPAGRLRTAPAEWPPLASPR